MRKAFVLLSGGIDSTTCLHMALAAKFDNVEGISVDYGQRHLKEIDYARKTCNKFGLFHTVLDLRSIIPKTMLTNPMAAVPSIAYSEIQGVSPTYVPFRNGLMLSALASFVHGRWTEEYSDDDNVGAQEWVLYFGAHAEDALNWAYPDCTPEFIGAMANAIYIGTYKAVRLFTPLGWMGKADIIRKGEELGVNWKDTWSCYKGGDMHCGVCPTCRARREGFVAAGVPDPTVYEAVTVAA